MSERTEESSDFSGVGRILFNTIVRLAASMGILAALVVCAGVLYLTFLASIPPCYDPGVAWYSCPPDPGKTLGIALAGLGALALASYGLVRLWASGWRKWSRRKRIFTVVAVMILVVAVPGSLPLVRPTYTVVVVTILLVAVAVAAYHRSTKRPTSHSLSGPPPY
jgi:peptidoglycan/LPS O-acetylase OafA/YrhL